MTSRLNDRPARDKEQEEVNLIAEAGQLMAAHRLATKLAEKHLAEYPQYEGHWQGWSLGKATDTLTTKLGVAFEAGDYVLIRNDSSWVSPGRWTAFSLRNCVDTALMYGITTVYSPEAEEALAEEIERLEALEADGILRIVR